MAKKCGPTPKKSKGGKLGKPATAMPMKKMKGY